MKDSFGFCNNFTANVKSTLISLFYLTRITWFFMLLGRLWSDTNTNSSFEPHELSVAVVVAKKLIISGYFWTSIEAVKSFDEHSYLFRKSDPWKIPINDGTVFKKLIAQRSRQSEPKPSLENQGNFGVRYISTNFFLAFRGQRGWWRLYPEKINNQTQTPVLREVAHQPQSISKASKLMPKCLNFRFFASHNISKQNQKFQNFST